MLGATWLREHARSSKYKEANIEFDRLWEAEVASIALACNLPAGPLPQTTSDLQKAAPAGMVSLPDGASASNNQHAADGLAAHGHPMPDVR